MSSDAGATTDEALTIVDETLARRRYFREKQREYRHKLKADAVAIAQEVMHLESIRDRLQVVSMTSVRKASEGPLSWHAIATVFKSEAHRVLTRRQSLVTQMQQFESLKRAMRRFVVMNIPVVEEVAANTRLSHTTTPDGAFVNTLQGYFVEADRFVMVMRQVENDEVHACHPLQRQTEVRQVSPTHVIMRSVCHNSRSFRAHDGVVSVDEIAVLRGIDLRGIEDDNQKEACVWREVIRRGNAQFLVWRQQFKALMQELTASVQ
ncbi:hypothetical protein DYB34_013191 [Aphanomyces astaci]|uniref:Uncharacterized protein n=1 Tax=Aphanomyces astaci TaxID=112090 RepID=A0A3R6ZEI9_APHAT|nr:hypothetical protein DYB34_013191 [Aphanomyces astaci]